MGKYAVGRNQVKEALGASLVEKVYIAKGSRGRAVDEVRQAARSAKVPVLQVNRRKLEELAGGLRDQGVVGLLSEIPYSSLEEILASAEKRGEPAFIALLDGIQDPHNLGAIIRSAEAAGLHGVVVTTRRSAGLSETVFRTSAGAAAHLPVAKVGNLSSTIESLKKKRVWVVGADQGADKACYETDLTGPLAVVVGGEGKGVRRLVKEHCDFTVRIPMAGRVNSLNASVAAALVFFEAKRQRDAR
jgi:23S rRNA (guanosine2251-2'-O)-methyltransferase